MAVADEAVTMTLSETMFHCQICMERFDSPRILPCQHNMCRSCLMALALRHCVGGKHPVDGDVITAASFPCPECRHECRVGKVGNVFENERLLSRYPENRMLKHLVDEAKLFQRKTFKNKFVQTVTENTLSLIQTKPVTREKGKNKKKYSVDDDSESNIKVDQCISLCLSGPDSVRVFDPRSKCNACKSRLYHRFLEMSLLFVMNCRGPPEQIRECINRLISDTTNITEIIYSNFLSGHFVNISMTNKSKNATDGWQHPLTIKETIQSARTNGEQWVNICNVLKQSWRLMILFISSVVVIGAICLKFVEIRWNTHKL